MHRPMTWGMCLLLVLAGTVRAQVDSPPPSPIESPSEDVAPAKGVVAPRVEEIEPPLFYLEDANGELKPAFGFKLEEFIQAYNQIHGLQPEARCPHYVLRKVTIAGEAKEEYARLTIHCDILLEHDGKTRVPLALDRAVLDGAPEYSGEELPMVLFERDRGGYVAWIKGKPGQQQRLTLKVLVPLNVVGDKTTLQLRIPSGTESELKLAVPVVGAVADASEGGMLTAVASADKTKTVLTVAGLRGDIELAWHKPEVCSATVPSVLEVAGKILARIDNQGIHYEATLRVHGYNKPFDSFRVRLPVDAELLPANGSAYRVTKVVDEASSTERGEIVEVELRKKTLGPVNVHLATRRVLDRSMFGQWIELTGFAVLGAVRQSGHLAVQVTDDLDVLWDPQLGVQQEEDLPDSLVQEDPVAGFRYSTQPCSLLARVAPRETRVSAEPQYVVLIDAGQIQLDATLKYTVRGKKARVLDVDLSGWQYDEVGPDNLVAVDGVVQSESGNLSIPLRQPSSGKIELKIKAHRPMAAEEKVLQLTFPQPKVATPGPAVVVLVVADNVQLTVDSKATRGLTRQQVSPVMALPKRQQTPLFYRGDLAKAVFVAQREVQPQKVAVNSTTMVFLDRQAPVLKQKFSYKIDYEPRDTLVLEVPRELADSGNLEFRIQGHEALSTVVSENAPSGESDGNGPVRIQVALPSPRIGTCDLEVRCPLSPHRLVPRSSIRRAIPLVVPLDGEVIGNRLVVTASSELQFSMLEGPWKKQTAATSPPLSVADAGQSTLEYVAEGRVGQAELELRLESRRTSHATIVERAMIQTWLTQHARQDRAIFRFSTHDKTLNIVFPPDTITSDVVVFLDGVPVETYPVGETTRRVDLPETTPGRQWLLEARAYNSNPQILRGHSTLELPRLEGNTWIRRMYWQLTLPKNDHVVNAPPGLVREFRWGWNGLFWGRDPLLKTADLESWIGVPENAELGAGDDSYLFSAFGSSGPFELTIVSRSWIVLGASGMALVFGLVLLYVPASRHPAALFILAVVLGCTGLLYPEPTLLVLQAAGLGLGLTLVAGLLERGVAKRRRSAITLETSDSVIDRDSTQTQFVIGAATDGDTTDTAPQTKPASDKTSSIIDRPGSEK
ncbi:MAG: hypothetical protein JW888_16380 [Pirellulales bacterium]|nr:hypothetical protein [Pirellulales bacterium]